MTYQMNNQWRMMALGGALVVVLIITASKALDVFKQQKIRQELSQAHYVPSQTASAADCTTHEQMSTSPISVSDLEYIVPMGRMGDAHVIPVDHQYWIPKTVSPDLNFTSSPLTYRIYSPADGTITVVEHLTQVPSEKTTPPPAVDDYRLAIEHGCSVSTVFAHVDVLNDQIMSSLGTPSESNGHMMYFVHIPVNAGELIGTLRQHPFDFSVYDETVVLPGLLNPTRYQQEAWRIHKVDPFDYFKEPVKNQLMAKVVRTQAPLGGKIDYDVSGKLVGNWFRAGTLGLYEQRSDGRGWDGQLAVAFDQYDPTHIIVSLGNYNGVARQFAVKGNTPDPSTVTPETGVVAYELVPFSYVDKNGKVWDQSSYTQGVRVVESDQVAGTVLFQLVENEKLTVEVFPGIKASEVKGFDIAAQVYQR